MTEVVARWSARYRGAVIAASARLAVARPSSPRRPDPPHARVAGPDPGASPRGARSLMDPATLIGVVLGLLVIVVANIMEGGNPASLLLLPADAAGLRRHLPGHAWPAAPWPTPRTPSKAFKRLHRQGASRPATSCRPSSRWPRRPAREGLLALEDVAEGHRRPVPGQGRHHGRSTAPTPRRSATSWRPRSHAKKAARQALREVLRPTPAPTRRPSASSAPSWAWCTCWRTSPSPRSSAT